MARHLQGFMSWCCGNRLGSLTAAPACWLGLEQLEPRLLLSTVTNLDDSGTGSLRDAIANAVSGDTITIDPGLEGDIVLTGGALMIDKSLTIVGPGADKVGINGNLSNRIFWIDDESGTLQNVSISGLTLKNGREDSADGGAITCSENLWISGCQFLSNQAMYGGGAIMMMYSNSLLTVSDSAFVSNRATGYANAAGGGIYTYGDLRIQNSTFSGNQADACGGGIYMYTSMGSPILTNVTLTQNTSDLDGDSNGEGGGIAVYGTVLPKLSNTIVANNTKGGLLNVSGADVYGPFKATGVNNLIGIADGSTNLDTQTGTQYGSVAGGRLNAQLLSCKDNGGPTWTCALDTDSPAYNTGNNLAASSLSYDQRGEGFDRQVGGTVDIGAYEYQIPLTTGTVTGAVYNDVGRNSTMDADDPRLAEWWVYDDANDNKQWDADETRVQTDSNGNYSLTVDAGTFHIRVITPTGWNGTVGFSSSISAGQTLSNYNFAKWRSGKVSGAWGWAKSEGSVQDDHGWSVAVDGDGNSYVAGAFCQTVDFSGTTTAQTLTSYGSADGFVAKYDASGALVWVKQVGGSQWDSARDLALDTSGNLLVTGYFKNEATFGGNTLSSAGEDDVFVMKMNAADGTILWAKQMGGASSDVGTGIVIDGDGNSYVSGLFALGASFGPYTLTAMGATDGFVTKLDGAGNVQWAHQMGGMGAAYQSAASDLALAGDGTLRVVGGFQGGFRYDGATTGVAAASNMDGFIAKVDAGDGSLQWAQRFGGINSGSMTDLWTQVAVDVDGSGNAYVTGAFEGEVTFGAETKTATGMYDIFVTKIAANNGFSWAQTFGGPGGDSGFGIAVSDAGDMAVVGSFEQSMSVAGKTHSSEGGSDIFLIGLNADGSVDGLLQGGGALDDRAVAIAVTGDNSMRLTGSFKSQPAQFNPYEVPSATLYSNGGWDIFLTRWVSPTASVSGYKFNDLNRDGKWDAGEPALSGWVIYHDANANGVLDSGEASSTTDAEGYYSLTVEPGLVVVRERMQTGWSQSAPTNGYYAELVTANQALTDRNFGNYQGTVDTTVSGVKFNDLNRNGTRDTGEPGLADWRIYVDLNNSGSWDADEPYGMTDAAGNYSLQTTATMFVLREQFKDQWAQSAPAVGAYLVTAAIGSTVTGKDFGNYYQETTDYPQYDFNHDGYTDRLWHDYATGQVTVDLMQGDTTLETVTLGTLSGNNWALVGAGDANGDHWPDIYWHNRSTGDLWYWRMQGTSYLGCQFVVNVADLNWHVGGVGGIGNDDYADLLWYNRHSGDLAAMFMADTRVLRTQSIGGVNPKWDMEGIGDLGPNKDGIVLWRNPETRKAAFWIMDGLLPKQVGVVDGPEINANSLSGGIFRDMHQQTNWAWWRQRDTGVNSRWQLTDTGRFIMAQTMSTVDNTSLWPANGGWGYYFDLSVVSDA